MSRDKLKLNAKRVELWKGLAFVTQQVDAQAVRSHWESLPLDERLRVLRFEEPELVAQLHEIVESLNMSDLLCYMLSIPGEKVTRKVGMDMFALEAGLGSNGVLLNPVFFAKRALIDRADFFEYLEGRLGSSFLNARPALTRKDWPLLFRSPPNSWEEFVKLILWLVELAVLDSAQVGTVTGSLVSSALFAAPAGKGSAAKRRARKQRLNHARKIEFCDHQEDFDTCPVCEGTRQLLRDPCPLCVDVSDEDCSYQTFQPKCLDRIDDEYEVRSVKILTTLCGSGVGDCVPQPVLQNKSLEIREIEAMTDDREGTCILNEPYPLCLDTADADCSYESSLPSLLDKCDEASEARSVEVSTNLDTSGVCVSTSQPVLANNAMGVCESTSNLPCASRPVRADVSDIHCSYAPPQRTLLVKYDDLQEGQEPSDSREGNVTTEFWTSPWHSCAPTRFAQEWQRCLFERSSPPDARAIGDRLSAEASQVVHRAVIKNTFVHILPSFSQARSAENRSQSCHLLSPPRSFRHSRDMGSM